MFALTIRFWYRGLIILGLIVVKNIKLEYKELPGIVATNVLLKYKKL